MKIPTPVRLALPSAVFAAMLSSAFATNTTYEWTSATLGGNWSVSGNWTVVSGSDTAVPSAGGDIGRLGDVTSGTRTVVLDGSAPGFISTIQFNQSTAGATNLLQISKAVTISNALDLSAVAGTEKISVDSGITFTANGAFTVGTNGVLELQGTATAAGTGTLTIQGGTLSIAAVSGTGSSQASVSSPFAMTSGTISIDNTGTGIVTDRRLAFNGTVNITGGSITKTNTGSSGAIFLNGATNTFNPDSFDTGIRVELAGFGAQSLTTSQTFSGAGLLLRTGIKTVTSTAAGGTINNVALMDQASASSGTNSGSYLKLGSNLALGASSAMPSITNYSNQVDGNGAIQVGIDTNGFTLDLSTTSTSAGKWTPTRGNASGSIQSGVTTAQWTLSNSGAAGVGGIKASAFDFSSAGTEINIGSGLVLIAAGGAGTSSNLGSAGTFDTSAKFVYAGNATSANAATLSSGRAIGALEVQTGYLRTTGATFNVAGGITVKAGARLDFTTVALTAPSVTLDIAGVSSLGQIVAGSYAYAGGLNLNFTSTLVAGTYDLFALSGSVTNGLGSVSVTGTAVASLSGASGVWTGSAGGFDFTFTEATGDLTVVASAVPEPSTFALLAGAVTLGACVLRRKRRA